MFGAGGSILTKLLQMTCREAGVIMRVLQSNQRAKNVQISARFLTTFDFDCEYLRNGSTYRTSEKKLDQPLPLPRWEKKMGELWSTNKTVLMAHIDQPKLIFFWRLYIIQFDH